MRKQSGQVKIDSESINVSRKRSFVWEARGAYVGRRGIQFFKQFENIQVDMTNI